MTSSEGNSVTLTWAASKGKTNKPITEISLEISPGTIGSAGADSIMGACGRSAGCESRNLDLYISIYNIIYIIIVQLYYSIINIKDEPISPFRPG